MAQDPIERLHYYQRQYLGAEDFKQEQRYHRSMRRRHNLGPHAWGIVTGLELLEIEQEGGGGGVDVFVMPGMAVDGYGREILVSEPYKLEGALFEPFQNQAQRYLRLFLAYDQEPAGRPRAGCPPGEQFARVRETFRVAVDPEPPPDDGLVVAGRRLVPGVEPDEEAPPEDVAARLTIPRDGSVPHQELPPDEDRPLWLVRLGNVLWDGQKLIADTADPPLLNQDRRYVRIVAEEVMAPDGRLKLRHRRASDPLPEDETDPRYGGVAVLLQGSLEVERLQVAKQDLHVVGKAGVGTTLPDVQLHVDGGTDATLGAGTGYVVLGAIDGPNVVLDPNEIQARDGGSSSALHLQADGGDLILHDHQAASRVVIKDSGNVGIGTPDPKVKLVVAGGTDAKLDDEESGYVLIGSPTGRNLLLDDNEIMAREAGGKSPLELQANGGDVRIHSHQAGTKVVVKDSGRLGIGTGNPTVRLQIEEGADAALDNGTGYLVLGAESGRNLVLDNNEIIARNDGSTSTLHVQAQGGELRVHNNRPEAERFVVDGSGDVGIGTVAPRARLHVEAGEDADLGNDSGYLVLGSVDGLNLVLDDNEIMARDNGSTSPLHLQANGGRLVVHRHLPELQRVVVNEQGRVGIGTASPNPFSKLDVRGQVRATSFLPVSDQRFKRDVTSVVDALTTLARLRGVSFEWKADEFEALGFAPGRQLGVIAQEVEAVLPELVATDPEGFKSVNVLGLLPVAIEALKELKASHEALEKRVEELEAAKEPKQRTYRSRKARAKKGG